MYRARNPLPVVPQKAVVKLCGTFAGLSCAFLCSTIATAAQPHSFRSIHHQRDQVLTDSGSLPNSAATPPDRPYKANVGGSIPSAPTNPKR
jgi:hypothetical protein